MRKNPPFRLRCMQSKYFNPAGHESLAAVVHDFGDPFPLATMYMHMWRHQESDIQRARKKFKEIEHPHSSSKPTPVDVVEGDVVSKAEHEKTLDEFIFEGRQKLLRRELPITATTLLAAIKIRSDIDKTTKDRRLDMIKSFFAGGGKQVEDNKT